MQEVILTTPVAVPLWLVLIGVAVFAVSLFYNVNARLRLKQIQDGLDEIKDELLKKLMLMAEPHTRGGRGGPPPPSGFGGDWMPGR